MALQLTNEWDKVFKKSDKVNHRKVSFLDKMADIRPYITQPHPSGDRAVR